MSMKIAVLVALCCVVLAVEARPSKKDDNHLLKRKLEGLLRMANGNNGQGSVGQGNNGQGNGNVIAKLDELLDRINRITYLVEYLAYGEASEDEASGDDSASESASGAYAREESGAKAREESGAKAREESGAYAREESGAGELEKLELELLKKLTARKVEQLQSSIE